MNKIKTKIFAAILCLSLLFTPMINNYAHAQWYTVDGISEFFTGDTSLGTWTDIANKIADAITKGLAYGSLAGYKVIALGLVQLSVSTAMGNDNSIIRDYNNYLYVSPQQIAMSNMNTFFNAVSRGRASSLNYEGVGPNYDAYLIAQARQAIVGQPFQTNLQDQVTDPSQMFTGGNMKGITSYMQCANNIMCYTLTATAKYNQEFAKAQDIAKNEAVNGFAPTKVNGRITKPAALVQNALLQVDQVGTQLIMNAKVDDETELPAALGQITAGMGISITSRLANYGISDSAGKEAIRDKTNQFPFSISYSSAGGVGITAANGGATSGTGVGALGKGATGQIGNTQINASAQVNPDGTAGTNIYGTQVNN